MSNQGGRQLVCLFKGLKTANYEVFGAQPDPVGFKLLSQAWWWRGNWQIGHISTPIEGGFYMSCHKVSDFMAYYKLFGVDY